MELNMISKGIQSTDAIEEYVEKKLERIQKYFDNELQADVTLDQNGNDKKVSFKVKVNSVHLVSASEHEDLYAAIDKNIDILERMIVKKKTMNEKKLKEGLDFEQEEKEEVVDEITKYQTYSLERLGVEDAKVILKNHRTNNFLVFVDIVTEKVNVIFKLKDGKNFGLIEPEE